MKGFSTLFLVLVTALPLLTGCDDANLFSNAPGQYEGFVAIKTQGRVRQTLVSANIADEGKQLLSVKIKGLKLDAAWEFKIKALNNQNVEVVGPAFKEGLKKPKTADACFTGGKNPAQPDARLCFDGHELTLDVLSATEGAFTVVLDKVDPSRRPVLETPKAYTIAEIIDLTLKQSFTNRIEFERVVQAKLNAQMAVSMLAPHISVGTIFGVITSGWTALLHAVGDLVPFLFPNRWFNVKEAALQAGAEADAFVIMKADSANIAEGLSYGIERDLKIVERLGVNLASVAQIREEIMAKERLHLLQAGSSDDVTAIMNSLEKGLSTMNEALDAEYAALAQTAGFYNPAAISSIQSSGEFDIETPIELDTASIMEVTLQRSYELHQMDTLVESARWGKLERYFSWLDPSGGYGSAIGVNLYFYLQAGPSQIRELMAKRDNLQSLLIQKTTLLFNSISRSLEQHRLAKEGAAIQQRRIERVLSNMHLGINFSLADLVNALVGKVQTDVDQINSEYGYYVGVSKINRLLFAGPYARLAPIQTP